MRCKNCGWDNSGGNTKCEKCNALLSENKAGESSSYVKTASTAFKPRTSVSGCEECGYPVRPDDAECPSCGHPVIPSMDYGMINEEPVISRGLHGATVIQKMNYDEPAVTGTKKSLHGATVIQKMNYDEPAVTGTKKPVSLHGATVIQKMNYDEEPGLAEPKTPASSRKLYSATDLLRIDYDNEPVVARAGKSTSLQGQSPARLSADSKQSIQESKIADITPPAITKQPERDNLSSAPTKSKKLAGFLVTYSIKPEGAFFPLFNGNTLIGRNPTSDVCIQDNQTVSEKHFSIHYKSLSRKFTFKDEQSDGGTFINGKRLEEGTLNNFDMIMIGNIQLLFMEIPQSSF